MNDPVPRYLAAFHPKRVAHLFTDVLVVGSGLAGLRAASAVDARLSVLLVTKQDLETSNSSYAQGGIAGVMSKQDEFAAHVQDTLTAGGELCDREIVERVVRAAPERIGELIGWGTRFDTEAGQLVLAREGGHSFNRVAHANGDSTGREIMRAMIAWTRRLRHVEIREHTFTLDLLTEGGRCRGALIVDARGDLFLVWAKQTILCTGGGGQLYRETTNPSVATGDGHAMAYRAGAEVRDMEFMQFHPTVLYIAGSSRSLITEAMRGEGALLVDKAGYRFMPDYDRRAELAPRDVVAQAIVNQMQKSGHPCVFLDLTHLDPHYVRTRFPGIDAKCREFRIDITRDRIPVRPGAHYMVGGVTVDEVGRTTLPGLWAAGEVASAGLHGANRLASNSLLEALVFGMTCGTGASDEALGTEDTYHASSLRNDPIGEVGPALDLSDIRNSLTSLMWRNVGVRRDADGLSQALGQIDHWCHYVLRRQFTDPRGWELQNMLTVARLMVMAAGARQESRGVHLRTDFPAADDANWRRHQAFRIDRC